MDSSDRRDGVAEEQRLRELIRKKRRSASSNLDVESKSTSAGSQNSEPANIPSSKTNTDGSTQQTVKAPPEQSPRVAASSSQEGKRSSNRTPEATQSSGNEQSSDKRTTQQKARGRRRKRERRRMNREARRKPYYDWEDNYSRGPTHSDYRRGYSGTERWERSFSRDRRRAPSYDRGGYGHPSPRYEYDYSHYRTRSWSRSPSRSQRGRPSGRRRGRSRSRSASSVSSASYDDKSHGRSRSRSKSRSPQRSHGRSHRYKSKRRRGGSWNERSRRSRSRSVSSDSMSSSSSTSDEEQEEMVSQTKKDESAFTKDQRTVFVSQLVMRTTEKDIRRYFRRKVKCRVIEVILLRDNRTGNHKGCAYVQFGRMEDVNKAVAVAGQAPDFQRFPILVKPSEAEKNYSVTASSSVVTASMMGTSTSATPLFSKEGKVIESQKVYVGNLGTDVTEEHIFALFSQFGNLEKVSMQIDPATRTSRGYAFLSFRDPKEANLAIQTMDGQILAGRQIKTGWASQTSAIQGVEVVKSQQFPDQSKQRTQKAFSVLAQISGFEDTKQSRSEISATAEKAIEAAMAGVLDVKGEPGVPTVAKAENDLVQQEAPPTATQGAKLVGGESPSKFILVHNMFDKDEESGEQFAAEIKEEFIEECSKFGKIISVTVMHSEAGGKIYAAFETEEAAVQCATNLAGRWFDKRQLRVDYIQESDMPKP